MIDRGPVPFNQASASNPVLSKRESPCVQGLRCIKLEHALPFRTERFLCRTELATEESMDARRAALRDRIPAELDIIGIEIPAGGRGRLL
jgi:hypothetical protein